MASKRRVTRRDEIACAAKRAFASPEEARSVYRWHEPYLCRVCGMWHLTSGVAGRVNKAKMVGMQFRPLFQRARRKFER